MRDEGEQKLVHVPCYVFKVISGRWLRRKMGKFVGGCNINGKMMLTIIKISKFSVVKINILLLHRQREKEMKEKEEINKSV